MHSLTVITTHGRLLTKNLETGESYAKVSQLAAAERCDFASLKELKLLLKKLARRRDSCVIRGSLKDGWPGALRRRKTCFEDVAQAWVMLDVDDVSAPAHLASWPYTDAHAEYVRSLLPEAFRSAGCVWQASASAGTSDKLKLHLWFLLDAPLTSAQLRVWLAGCTVIDRSTLRSVQPHYTADPIGGRKGKRLGKLKGPRVTTPLEIVSVEPAAASELERRPEGCADVSDAQLEGAYAAATRRARALLQSATVAYHDAYKAGTYFGPAVALSTWNDKRKGHRRSAWLPEAERLARKWGKRFAELPDTKHDAELYTKRVLEGIEWGLAEERARLATQSQKARDEAIERTKELQAKLLGKLVKSAGSERVLKEVGAELGKYAHVIGREELLEKLQQYSGLSSVQCEAAIADAKPVDLSSWREGLLLNKDEIVSTDENILRIFDSYPGFMQSFRYNERAQQLELTSENLFGFREGPVIEEELQHALTRWLGDLGMRRVAAYRVLALFNAYAKKVKRYDPFLVMFPEALLSAEEAKAKLGALKPRLDNWLTRHMGVETSAYVRAAAAKTLIAAVARAVQPGAQVDAMLVLMGDQGIGKTSVVRTLAGVIDGYRELLDTRDKDHLLIMQSGLLVEVNELRALRTSMEETIKAFFTRKVDVLRAPYARKAEDHPRRIVFIGTTNDDEFLSDHTNRRYWPVWCNEGLPMTEKHAVALWREAALRYATGEKWWLEDPEVVSQHGVATGHARAENVIETVLRKQLRNKNKVRLLDAVRMVHPDATDVGRASRGIAQALRALGFSRKHTKKSRFWVRSA